MFWKYVQMLWKAGDIKNLKLFQTNKSISCSENLSTKGKNWKRISVKVEN